MIYAIIHNDKVISRILWDGEGEFTYPFSYDRVVADESLQIGMRWDGERWNPPVTHNWHHLEYSHRIIAPKALINQVPEMLFKLAVLQKLPMEDVGDAVWIYCNGIDTEDAPVFEQLAGLITLELQSDVVQN